MANLDHISRAVQRARQERDLVARKKIVPDMEQAIYSQARAINVSQDFLREQCIVTGEEYDDEYTNTYKQLRTSVLRQLRQNGWNTFGVTSSVPGEGKTLTAINLSLQLAMETNQIVLLVDADLRRPSIHKYFGYEPEVGLGDYFLSEIPIAEMLIHPEIGNLFILTGNKPIRNSSEKLASPKMVSLIKELKAHYSSRLLVIFDLPPLLLSDDVIAFSPSLDALLFVVEDGKVSRNELARSAELLKDLPLLGTVLNKAKEKMPGYYSAYPY
jgi:protein-tyrosine kinase